MIVLESEQSCCLIPEEDTVSIRMDGNRIVYQNGQIAVNGKKQHSERKISHNGTYLFFSIGRRKYVISKYENLQGYDVFIKYALSPAISIGGALEDDIYLHDETVERSQITIDTCRHTICDTGGCHHLYRDGKRVETSLYHPGERYVFASLVFIMMRHFILVNQVTDCYISLSAFEKSEEILKPVLSSWQICEQEALPSLCIRETVRFPRPLPVSTSLNIQSVGPALTMGLCSTLIAFLMAYNSYQQGRELITLLPMLLFPIMMFGSTLIWYFIRRHISKKERKQAEEKEMERFEKRLENLKEEKKKLIQLYEKTAEAKFPLPSVLMESWQSSSCHPVIDRYDSDFLSLRLGDGKRKIKMEIKEEGRDTAEECCLSSLETCRREMETDVEVPVILHLNETPHVRIADETEDQAFTCWLILQLFTLYRPSDVSLIWIQEGEIPVQLDSLAHLRGRSGMRIYSRAAFQEVSESLRMENDNRHVYLCFVSGCEKLFPSDSPVLFFHDAYACADASIEVNGQEGILRLVSCREKCVFQPALIRKETFLQALACAAVSHSSCMHNGEYGFLEVNGISHLKEIRKAVLWQKNHGAEHLRCVLGVDDAGVPIELDLHEKGDGPHGLIAGTTGSGKSECIISMILSLAIRYSPADLQIVIIDFKGTGLLQALSEKKKPLKHIAGSLSNLDAQDGERVLVSLKRECQYRESLFDAMHMAAGHDISSIDAYSSCWQKEYELPYLAHLFIVIDEFAQLKKENPQFMDELVSIARVGRSLGMHMLLSTQKPSGIVSGQIASNTRYRICLKVNDPEDSRDMLNDTCAAVIARPGEFYVNTDGIMRHGCCGYSGRRYVRSERDMEVYNSFREQLFKTEETGPSERQCAVHALLSIPSDAFRVRPLWPERINAVTFAQLKTVPEAIGIIDDFHLGQYRPFCLSSRLLVLCDQTAAAVSFVRACLCHALPEDREIYLLTSFSRHDLPQIRGISGILSYEDDDALDRLRTRLKGTRRALVIMDDTALFLQESEERTQLLKQWCRRENGLQIIAVIRQNQDLSHRLAVLFQQKIVLSAIHEREISDFFEKTYHGAFKEENAFLIRENGHCMRGVYPAVSDEDLVQVQRKAGSYYTMPILPEVFISDEADVIGFYLDDLAKFRIDAERQLIVISHYDVTSLPLFHHLKAQGKDCVFDYEGRDTEAEAVFTLCDVYERSPLRKRKDALLLFMGTGFRKQFALKAYLSRELKENEGIVFDHGRARRVRLAEYREAEWQKEL